MAKMFGKLQSPTAAGARGGVATRLGDEQLTSELNNVGRGDAAGGKTTVTTKLFSDGSGLLQVTRGTRQISLRWVGEDDGTPTLIAYATKNASRVPGALVDVEIDAMEVPHG